MLHPPSDRERKGDVGENITLEQLPVLDHHADVLAKGAGIDIVQVVPVIENRAFFRLLKAQQQPHQSRFAASRSSNDGDVFTGFDCGSSKNM